MAGNERKPFPPKADYSKLAGEYEFSRRRTGLGDGPWLRAILEYGEFRPGQRVLDVGAGTGRWAREMGRCGLSTVAVEPSGEMIKEGLKAGSGEEILWVRAAAPGLPFREESFDRILFILVLQHIEEITATFRRTYSILRPGGRILIRTCDHEYIRRYVLAEYFPGYREVELASFPEVRGLMDNLAAIGFVDIQTRTVREEVVHSAAEYLNRVKARFISTLQRIGETNFEKGLHNLRQALEGRTEFRYTIEHEIVTAARPP